MNCINCGAEISAKFCAQCGQRSLSRELHSRRAGMTSGPGFMDLMVCFLVRLEI